LADGKIDDLHLDLGKNGPDIPIAPKIKNSAQGIGMGVFALFYGKVKNAAGSKSLFDICQNMGKTGMRNMDKRTGSHDGVKCERRKIKGFKIPFHDTASGMPHSQVRQPSGPLKAGG